MRTLVAAVVVLASVSSFAQSMGVDVDVNNFGVNMNVNMKQRGQRQRPVEAPPPAPVTPPMGAPINDGFAVLDEQMDPNYNLRVLDPAGASCEIFNGEDASEGVRTVPFNYQGRSGQFYRLRMTAAGALVFDDKVEIKQFRTTVVRLAGGGRRQGRGGQTVVIVQPAPAPAPAPVAAGPAPMSPDAFASLLKAMKNEAFSQGQIRVLQSASGKHYFTVAQVGELIEVPSFSAEKLKVVSLTKDRIIDRENSFQLYEHFTFDSDKEKARTILGD